MDEYIRIYSQMLSVKEAHPWTLLEMLECIPKKDRVAVVKLITGEFAITAAVSTLEDGGSAINDLDYNFFNEIITPSTINGETGPLANRPFISIIRSNRIDLVKLAIERGANVNMEETTDNFYGEDETSTVLLEAVENSTAEIVKLLLDAGAQFLCDGFKELRVAYHNSEEMYKLIGNSGIQNIKHPHYEYLLFAVSCCDIDDVEKLLSTGIPVNSNHIIYSYDKIHRRGISLHLISKAFLRPIEYMQLLFKHGLDLITPTDAYIADLEYPYIAYLLTLDLPIEEIRSKLDLLLQHGCDKNLAFECKTALQIATEKNFTDILTLLV